nr:calcium-binding protein [Sphaerospermopsis sp. FACHB-1194]
MSILIGASVSERDTISQNNPGLGLTGSDSTPSLLYRADPNGLLARNTASHDVSSTITDQLGISGVNKAIWDFDSTTLSAVVVGIKSLSNREPLFLVGTNGNDYLVGGAGNEFLIGLNGNDYLDGGAGNDGLIGGSDNDSLEGGAGNDLLSGDSGNDYLNGGAGNDGLSGGSDNDSLEGGAGNDGLGGDSGNDYLNGGAGNDTLYGDNGNDSLEGSTGNDILFGGSGKDIYIFNKGDGQDTISDWDTASGNTDTIRFGTGINPTDITLTRDPHNLYLSYGTTDKITVKNWGGASYQIEKVEFANGITWDKTKLLTAPFMGTVNDDYFFGTERNDTFYGLAGNDSLYGGSGNDIYIFNQGDGQDTISDWDTTSGNTDTIRFGIGINPTDITLTRDQDNLYLSYATTDKITVKNWGSASYQIEKVEFANGITWDKTKLLTAPFMGTVNNDSLYGTEGNDTLYGLAGNDNLYGNDGNDSLEGGTGNDSLDGNDGNDSLEGGTGNDSLDGNDGNDSLEGGTGNDSLDGNDGNDSLEGGTGNDSLDGGSGNDIYIFNQGDGQDTISDWDTASGNTDTIRFGTGINPTDITLTRDQDNLYLSYATTDKITVKNWGSASYQIEKVEFANGITWDKAKLLTATFMGTVNDDYNYGTEGNETFYGLAGNDILSGNDGNDSLEGGTGNDILFGGSGKDIYIFNRGDGQDTIVDFDSTSGNIDIIRFGTGINPTDITLTRDQDNLYISYGTTDKITLPDWGGDADYQIEKIEFANDSTWQIIDNANELKIVSLNQAPTNLTLSNTNIAENQAIGTVIGNFNTTDPDANNTFTYSLVSGTGATDNALFTISNNQLKANSIFDFETKNSYSIRVRTTDQGGLTFEKQLTIGVTNVNESPTNLTLSNINIAENQAIGTVIGNFTTTDPDANNTFTYSLVSGTGATDNALFTISNNQLKANSIFDFETKNSYSIRVRTTDQGGLTFEKQLTIGVTNVNESPTNLTLSNTNIAENQAIGTVIGNFTSTDPDANNTFTYSLVSGTGATDNALFSINNNQLRANSSFNFETKNSYSIRVRTTDKNGLSFEKQLTIGVTNVDNIITGNANNENFTTTTEKDIIDAQGGNDIITSVFGNLQQNDIINGGAGFDTLNITGGNATNSISIDLNNTTNQVNITGTKITNFEQFNLSNFAGQSNFLGNSANNIFNGGNGNDIINGGDGNDTLIGGAGNDLLTGGKGQDILTGGLGSDRFDYRNLTDSLLSGFDMITDFNATTGNDLFRVSTARAGFVNVGAVNTLNAADIGAKLTATAFKSNFAAQFSFGQKTFVAINDTTAGFNAATDAIIEVTGLTGTVNVNNFVIS